MDETQSLAAQALREPPALSPDIFTRSDGGSARLARPRLTHIIEIDRAAIKIDPTAGATTEIATLRQKIAAADADKTSTRTPALLPSTIARPDGGPSTADAATEIATLRQKLAAAAANKTKSAPSLDRKRTAALLPLDATARTPSAAAQVMHGRASESARAPEWPRLVAVFIAGELGFAGMA